VLVVQASPGLGAQWSSQLNPCRSMTSFALMLRPTDSGWAVCLSNGQEVVRYYGWFSRRLAVRYLERYTKQLHPPLSR
jgi:hypothetical protein